MVEVPARVCPASKSVPQHKDKKHGKGAVLSSWICVVYLTDQPGSALVLVDDVTGREFSVAIRPGRMCCWPNARFSHRVDVDPAVAAGALAAQVAELASCRCMLGPMAFSQSPGPGSSCKEIVYAEGGCGGCCGGGCGGGGCGGGGCGGGGNVPPIKDTARVRVLGTSNLRAVVCLTQGTADVATLGATFVPRLYNGVHTRSRFGKTTIKAVPYMRETAISQALWQQLQQEITGLEVQLAQIANSSSPCTGSEMCCLWCNKETMAKHADFLAVVARIKSTRDEHMARVNIQIFALGARLAFGGNNDAYFLDVATESDQPTATPLGAPNLAPPVGLQMERLDSSAPAPLAAFNVECPANTQPGSRILFSTPQGQKLHVTVPAGVCPGQSFLVQVPQPAQPMVQPLVAQSGMR